MHVGHMLAMGGEADADADGVLAALFGPWIRLAVPIRPEEQDRKARAADPRRSPLLDPLWCWSRVPDG